MSQTVNKNQAINTIDPATLKQLIDSNTITLIDVREPVEYARERIVGAKLFPLSQFNPNKLQQETTNKPLILYCQSSNRSYQAAQKLLASGYTEISHLQGGLNAWKQQGYPTQINKNAPIPIMRQVQIVAGSLVFTGTILGAFISPWFLILSGFVGAGLMFAGISGTCMMANLLIKLPYNQINNQ
ncbi:rhodanese-like domain-containing protein [Crocosphaera sp. UHCC 0190]|uniref:rhodanese-like domain-containing protein n=1 Tax=Crocosphaera sp. UHCC 0190 TaxID=3110246 RepID=UPI002B1EDD9E|nr:rhodanese-like domain-containing protein [Crocosphaera sp. UHCC 0190]MEA5511217.1 rhodanese-like domain-containing protein [Crocosphaera sp. UHCC 0190]